MTTPHAQCARCGVKTKDRLCQEKAGRHPEFCPTHHHLDTVDRAMAEMQRPEVKEFARHASLQEAEGYGGKELGPAGIRPIKTRIQETIEFAHRMDYQRLGLAFCMGLQREAKVVERLFTGHGFEVVSALCKMGRTPKEEIGVRDDQKICVGTMEPLCNPIAQAFVLNEAHTEFNIVMGLCVGHDALFLKYAEAMCTVFAVKDRVTGHNPLAAIYTLDSYYTALK